MRGRAILTAGAAVLLLAGAARAAAEIRLEPPPPWETALSFTYRSWTVKRDGSPDRTASLWTAPVAVGRRIGDAGSISFLFRNAVASVEGEEKSEYAGPVDAELGGAFFLDDRRWRFDLRLGLPTGRAPIDEEEELAAGVLANRLLGFPVKRLGEGFDAGLGAARVFRVPGGPLLSLGAGYLRKGEYDYIETESGMVRYKPGDEAFLAAGAEREIDRGGVRYRFAGDLRYRLFRRDERNGEAFYDEGNQLELLATAALRFPGGNGLRLAAFLLFKGEGSEEGAFGAEAPDSLSLERYLARGLTGDAQEIRAEYDHPLGARAALIASAGLALYGEYPGAAGAEEGLLGSGRVWRAGGGARIRIGAAGVLDVRLAGLFGEAEDGAVDLSGLDLLSSLSWVF